MIILSFGVRSRLKNTTQMDTCFSPYEFVDIDLNFSGRGQFSPPGLCRVARLEVCVDFCTTSSFSFPSALHTPLPSQSRFHNQPSKQCTPNAHLLRLRICKRTDRLTRFAVARREQSAVSMERFLRKGAEDGNVEVRAQPRRDARERAESSSAQLQTRRH